MQSVITSKYQTTIPKAVREKLGLSVKDALDWKVEWKIGTAPFFECFQTTTILLITSQKNSLDQTSSASGFFTKGSTTFLA
jgi:AbrB family looped-hinge helix DNA binding protein